MTENSTPAIVDEETADAFYKPKLSLIFYQNTNQKFYIEAVPLLENNGKYECGAGRPLDEETLNDLSTAMKTVERTMITTGTDRFLPENLLYIHQTAMKQVICWYQPPCERVMRFTEDHDDKLKTGVRCIPGLIYLFCNDNLYLFAFKGKKRPIPATILFKAPFYNVDSDGRVCMGTVRKKAFRKSYYVDLMDAWETKLWNSFFTDEDYGNRIAGKLKDAWKKEKQPFDETKLVKQKQSLKNILQKI